MTSDRSDASIVLLLQQELAPYPGRLAGSLRDALGVSIAVMAAMTLRVSGISLALALLFLMQRERPGLTLRVGLQIFSGAVAACAATLFWVQITDGSEVARFLGLVFGILIAAFCMSATTAPLFWTIFGFYGFVDLASWDAHRPSDQIVTSTLFNVASLGLVVLSATAVEFLFGTKHPAEELQRQMVERLRTLGRFFDALAEGKNAQDDENARSLRNTLLQHAHAGDLYLNELYDRVRSSNSLSQVPLGIHYRIGLLTRAIEKSVLLGFSRSMPGAREQSLAAYRAIARLCDELQAPHIHTHSLPLETPAPLRDIFRELEQYGSSLTHKDGPTTTTSKKPRAALTFSFFLPGVFESPDAILYALKLTLAAAICYTIYNAVAWPGILTCVVTVLFTGLSSTGAMKQKQLYRFSGAAIGGMLGIATVSLLYPNMDSITSLLVVVAPIALLSGWVLRSPKMSYVGVQIGFAFFLTALPGFSATTQIAPARDRVIGVALGILVMWFIFDQLWPSRTSDVLRRALLRIREATAQVELVNASEGSPDRSSFAGLRAAVSLELANVQQLDFAVRFEAGRHRRREMARSRRLIREIEAASAEFYEAALRITSR